MQIFTIRLNSLLKENKITRSKLAKDLKLGKATILNWCNGINEPKATQIAEIATYFDVTSDYLLGLEDEGGRRNGSIKNSFNNFSGNKGNISFK